MSATPNDVALVTGARGGIGREVVARLRAAGLRVAAVGRDAAVMRVNLDSAVCILQAWVRALRADGLSGAAVLASSVVARINVANHEAIAAAKGGVEALARSAAATHAAHEVLAIDGGFTPVRPLVA